MFTIALVNQKGGVGKSTTAVNLSAGLARLGKRVLLIDLDPQAHATIALGLDPRQLDATVYHVLAGSKTAREAIRPVAENLSILPANIALAGGEAELAGVPEPHAVLRNAMAQLDATDFDFAIVDSPPQLGFLNVNSLAWVREVYIPVTCEFYALHGLALLTETVERVRARLNPELRIAGVITTMMHPRRAITRDVLADLERHFPDRVLKTRIRVNVRLVEAPSHGKSIFDYAPESNGATDYMNLAREVLERMPAVEEAPDPLAHVFAAALEAPARVEAPAEEPAAPVETPVAEPAAQADPELAAEPVAQIEPEPVAAPVAEATPAPAAEAAPAVEVPPVESWQERLARLMAQMPKPMPPAPEPEPAAEAPAEPDVIVEPDPDAAPAEKSEVILSPTAQAEAEQDIVLQPDPEPAAASPYVQLPAEAPLTTPVAPAESPYVAMEPGAPLTTPAGRPEEAAVNPQSSPSVTLGSSVYAQRTALAGLKPIVTAKAKGAAPAEPEKPKGLLGKIGKLLGR
jgi:chromosome partitioning protein